MGINIREIQKIQKFLNQCIEEHASHPPSLNFRAQAQGIFLPKKKQRKSTPTKDMETKT